jgi:hypothetical protein
MAAVKGIDFVVRDHLNRVIWRKVNCSRCGREFEQYEVNPAWLDALTPDEQKYYRVSCQIENERAYQPARCHVCTRPQLTQGEIHL